MKKTAVTAIAVMIVIALIVLCIVFGGSGLSALQKETLNILLIVCASSIAYCFIAGELSQNFSQMDKLWSILPIAYCWIITIKGGLKPRLVIYAAIVTVWGVRLTLNFARKGAYRLRFWDGEEDYRWAVVRGMPIFGNRFAWALFDLLFISFYQNVLVLGICLPALASMESAAPICVWDVFAFVFAAAFLALEALSDEYQWRFHQTKKELLSQGSALDSLPYPYHLGFNTTGPWAYMRHPNYLGEQGVWLSLYYVTVGAGAANHIFFNWSGVGPLLLVLLFMGSSVLGESISLTKYPLYSDYINCVCKYLPIHRYGNKA